MRNPNGYGGIEKMSGKRRNPYRVRITKKFILEDGKAKQIRHTLGYYPTKAAAIQALAEYNTNPYDLTENKTVKEYYAIWSKKKFEKIATSGVHQYNAAYKWIKPIENMYIRDVKTSHIQGIIDECDKSYTIKSAIKQIFKEIMNECLANDVIKQNYAELVKLGKKERAEERKPIGKKDIDTLWSLQGDLTADIFLILLYTGLRISELLTLKKEDVNISENYLDIKTSKTDAGIRHVPISPLIAPIINFYHSSSILYLIETKSGNKVEYANFTARNLKDLNSVLTEPHKCHDTRVTFISRWKELKLDALYLKKIVGHQPGNVTDAVYTKIKDETLAAELEKFYY